MAVIKIDDLEFKNQAEAKQYVRDILKTTGFSNPIPVVHLKFFRALIERHPEWAIKAVLVSPRFK